MENALIVDLETTTPSSKPDFRVDSITQVGWLPLDGDTAYWADCLCPLPPFDPIICHNAMYDVGILARVATFAQDRWAFLRHVNVHDTMALAYCAGAKDLSLPKQVSWKQRAAIGEEQYLAQDLFETRDYFNRLMSKNEGTAYEVDRRLIPALIDCSYRGYEIDQDRLEQAIWEAARTCNLQRGLFNRLIEGEEVLISRRKKTYSRQICRRCSILKKDVRVSPKRHPKGKTTRKKLPLTVEELPDMSPGMVSSAHRQSETDEREDSLPGADTQPPTETVADAGGIPGGPSRRQNDPSSSARNDVAPTPIAGMVGTSPPSEQQQSRQPRGKSGVGSSGSSSRDSSLSTLSEHFPDQVKCDHLWTSERGVEYVEKHGPPDIGSPKQLAKLFGCPDTTKEQLRESISEDILVDTILTWRGAAKLFTTYYMPHRGQDRMSGLFNITPPEEGEGGATTGRLSSERPNMQNQTPLMQRCLRAPDGYLLRRGDFPQLELRCAAQISQDPVMLEALNDPSRDLHQEAADRLFNGDRLRGKVFNFKELYIAGEQVRAMYPRWYDWCEEHWSEVQRTGVSVMPEPPLHKRTIPLLMLDHARRQAINHPPQGLAGYIMKDALAVMFEHGFQLVNQIHDAGHDYVPEDGDRDLQREEMASIMTEVAWKYLPDVGATVKAEDIKISKYWSDER